MLLPVWVFEPNRVRTLEILMFEGSKKSVGGVACGVVAEMIGDPCQYDCGNDGGDDQLSAT